MPNFDKSGPNAEGPMSGRGRGNCNTDNSSSCRQGRGRKRRCNNRESEILRRLDEIEAKLNS